MADVNRGNRPLSPHITIYRKQITSASSIMVRITGIACLIASVIVVGWLLAAGGSERAFATTDGLVRGFLGDLILFFGSWGLFYHMLGRLRHLIWDLGYGWDVPVSEKMGYGMFIGATVLAFITALIV